MKVLVAGPLGDLGKQVTKLLLHDRHEVWGITRSRGRLGDLEHRGIRGVPADLLDERATAEAVEHIRPDAIVAVPIALPERGPMRPADLQATNRLRVEGTRNLLHAAVASGVRRFVSESLVAIYGYGDRSGELLSESSTTQSVAPSRTVQPALDALHQQEEMVLAASSLRKIEGISVRLGFYYGADVASTRFMARLLRRRAMAVSDTRGALPWIEISDAATGVVAALEEGNAGGIYNIVGDDSIGLGEMAHAVAEQMGVSPPWELPAWMIRLTVPYVALVSETRLFVSNARAKDELGWQPRFPTVREGLEHAAAAL